MEGERRSPFRHDDNIAEVVDYIADYSNDGEDYEEASEFVPLTPRDGGIQIEDYIYDDEEDSEFVPLTPRDGGVQGYQWTPPLKQGSPAGEALSLQHEDDENNSQERGQEEEDQQCTAFVPAVAPQNQNQSLRSLVSPPTLAQPKVPYGLGFNVNNRTRIPLNPLEPNTMNQLTPQPMRRASSFDLSPDHSEDQLSHASAASPQDPYGDFAASPALLAVHPGYYAVPSPGEESTIAVFQRDSSPGYSQESSVLDRSQQNRQMSYRSSASRSLLYGEVISLEAGRRHGITNGKGRAPESSDIGTNGPYIPEGADEEIAQFYPVDLDDDIEAMPLEGIVIGGGKRPVQSTHVNPPDSPEASYLHFRPFGHGESWLVQVQKKATHLGSLAGQAALLASKASHQVLQKYVLDHSSPRHSRSSELGVLDYLQRSQMENLGPVADNEEFFDFALVLTPQESYRFWSDLLDFGLESLGPDDAAPPTDNPIETASTHSTETESCYSADEPGETMKDYAKPLTGMHHRRGGKLGASPSSVQRGNVDARQSIATSVYSSANKRDSQHRLSLFEKALGQYSPQVKKMLDDPALGEMISPSPMKMSAARRRWGNHAAGKPGAPNILSPPVRSLTRGNLGSIRKLQIKNTPQGSDNEKVRDADSLPDEYYPNPVIPRGIAARTNGLLTFLSALKRGIVLRRHRPNKDPVYCKIFSENGGDTIQYHLIEPEEAMVAFKEQRVRYNRNLNHGSSPGTVRSLTREWSSWDAPGDGSPVHKFKLPDYIAAQRYRQKIMRERGITKRFLDFATKAANSGFASAADIVAVHPASHLDPRCKKGELGTQSLRRSKAAHHTPFTFSLVTAAGQRFKAGKPKDAEGNENKWYSGEGSDLQFNVLDFEAATDGEYWLVFRGFLLLHRDAAVGRFAAERRAGIGGGKRLGGEGDGEDADGENRLHPDEFLEPATVGLIERAIVKARKTDDTYMKGYVLPKAIPPPPDYFLGFRSPGTQIWSRLRMAGLETLRIYAVDTRRVMIKIRCPQDRLTDVAEVLRLKMKTLDGGFAPFREDTADVFKARCDPLECPPIYQGTMASLLHSKDRQTIIDFIIGSRIRDSGAELGQTTDVGKMIQFRVPLHMHRKLDALFKLWVFWWKREYWTDRDGRSLTSGPTQLNVIDEDHSRFNDEEVRYREKGPPNIFKRFFMGAFYQPLDAIEEYFGEQVTFYFAWMQHCASHLLVLAILGVIVTLIQLSSKNADHPIRPFFAMAVMIWTFIVLVNWRKRSNFLAYRWGTMDYKVQETPRPEFFGEYVTDELTNEWVVKYPKWKRWLKYCISAPVSILFTGVGMLLILLVHANRDLQMAAYVTKMTNGEDTEPFRFKLSLDAIGQSAPKVDIPLTRDLLLDGTFWTLMVALPAMLGLCIPILNLILMRISIMLNNFENYRTESEYRTHLIIKVFSFRFVSQFGTIYYYAIVSLSDKGDTKQAIENGLLRMATSILVYTTVSHWWTIFLQVYFFMFIRQIKRFNYRRMLRQELRAIALEEDSISKTAEDSAGGLEKRRIRLMNKRLLLNQAQDDVWFEVMNNPHDSFPEYITAVSQFGFVACFSVVLPITPLLCLFNHLLSIRYDAYKLCRGRRRPLAQKTGGIGVWEHLLHVLAVIAVLTNCWLMGFTSSLFTGLKENIDGLAIFAIVVAWEHAMLLIKYVMETTISPLPRSVRDHVRKSQYSAERQRHKSLRKKKDRRSKVSKGNVEQQRTIFRASPKENCTPIHQTVYESPEVIRTIPTSTSEESSGLYSA